MRAKAYGRTDNGRVRDHNEDALLINDELGLFIVSDGLGGHSAGEVASAMTCEIIQREVEAGYESISSAPERKRGTAASELLRTAIRKACKEVYDSGRESDDRAGMAATVVALLIIHDTAVVAHVGDSRMYMLRDSQAHLMTEDHSLVLEQLRAGMISREEALRSRLGSIVTRAVGLSSDCVVDTLEIELAPGDAYILCTDGLSDYVAAKELAKIFDTSPLHEIPDCLVNLASVRGGADNITLIIVGSFIETQTDAPTVERKIDALHKIPLFRHLTYKDLIKVLNVVHLTDCPPGQSIIHEGDPSNELFVLLDGEAEVRKNGQRLADLSANAFFGEMGMIDNAPRSADVITLTPASLLSIRRKDFYRLLRSDPYLAVKVLSAFCQVLNERLRRTSGELSGIKRQMLENFTNVADRWFVDEPTRLIEDLTDEIEIIDPD